MMEDGLAGKALHCKPEDPVLQIHRTHIKKLVTVEHACNPTNGEMRDRETEPWKPMS